MKQIFNYKALKVCYTHKPKQKHTYISIEEDGTLSLRSPIKNMSRLTAIIEEKEPWIAKQLRRKAQAPQIEVGQEVLFLGERYALNHDAVSRLEVYIERIKIKTIANMQSCYDRFYKEQCEQYLPQRVAYFSHKMQLNCESIGYRKMRRRWGSCDSKKRLTFNSSIMKLSVKQIDYIVVHELAHIKHMNHSAQFHALVQCYIEDSKSIENSLRYIRP
jgi:hypothetical protein